MARQEIVLGSWLLKMAHGEIVLESCFSPCSNFVVLGVVLPLLRLV